MISFPNRFAAVVVLIAAASVAAGCASDVLPSAKSHETGRLDIAAPLAFELPPGGRALATLSQGQLLRQIQLAPQGEMYAATLEAMAVGDWSVVVQLFDAEGNVTHEGAGAVRVRADSPSTLTLDVRPRQARLEIVVDLSGFDLADAVGKVRTTFHNGQTVTLTQEEPGLFHGVKPLDPGDYDFSVGLYGEAFYASDRIYESPWESVHLAPGQTVRVTWEAQSGTASIEANFLDLPLPPQTVAVASDESGRRLQWEPRQEAEVVGYRVYLRADEFRPFEEKGFVAAPGYAWPIESNAFSRSDQVWFAVTSVTEDGRESYRSPAVTVFR